MDRELQQKINNLPGRPGVYVFKDKKNKILYIGKAKNLKPRVKSYWAESNELTPTKQRMVDLIKTLEYTITDTENEALLLETTLIKEHKPRYNIILKDDKYWQYIKIDYDSTWPQIYTTRSIDHRLTQKLSVAPTDNTQTNAEKLKSKNIYFGPYTSGYAVKEILRLIKKIFPVCLYPPINKEGTKGGRTRKSCFNYHLGRCLGPCVGKITLEEYSRVFEDIKRFIIGSHAQLIKKLKSKMTQFSKDKHFEAAARIRDQIKALEKLGQKQKVVLSKNENIDIISLYQENEKTAINLFKIRQGKLLDKFNSLIKTIDSTDNEIIKSFIEQYYLATTDKPQQILTCYKLPIKKILKIPIKKIQRSKKYQLIKLGELNAREYLIQQGIFFDKQQKKQKLILGELKKILKLKTIPKRIETYDVSNIQGKFAVGVMAVFENSLPKKSDYRKFKIKIENKSNDAAMISEILHRRFTHQEWPKPDLIVVDGGKIQLSAAAKELKNQKIKKQKNINIIALAKKQEEIYLLNKIKPIKLLKSSKVLQLLQQTRDEAHRFAIIYYRKRHKKSLFEKF